MCAGGVMMHNWGARVFISMKRKKKGEFSAFKNVFIAFITWRFPN